MSIMSFYSPKGSYLIDYNIFTYYQFYEIVLTSLEGTFHMVNENNEIVLKRDNRNESHLALLKDIHDLIFQYCKHILELFPDVLLAKLIKKHRFFAGFCKEYRF